MALNGTFKSSQVTDVGNYPSYVYVTWSATPNIEKNTSTISWTCYGGSYYNNAVRWTTTGPVVVKINGQTVLNKTGRFNMTKDMYLGSGSLEVQHNANGEKTVAVSISAAIYYGTTSSTYSGNITLNPIARASKITSAEETVIGNNCNIKWTPANKSFAYKLEFSLGSWSKTTEYITPNTTGKYTYAGYTIPTTLYSYLPNDKEGEMKVILHTYSSSSSSAKLLGSSEQKKFKVTIPDSIMPTAGVVTLTPDPIKLNGTSYNYLVQNVNKLKISMSGASAGSGSSIKSYTFSGSSLSTTQTTSSLTVNSVGQAGLREYSVTVRDKRERPATATAQIECYEYSKPSVVLKISRDKTTATCTYKATYSSINGKNTATVKIYADKKLKKTITGVKNGVSEAVTIDLDSANTSYEIYATITDAIGTETKSNNNNVHGASRVMNITPDGTGVAFGKFAENKNCVDVPKLMSRNNVLITTANRGYFGKNSQGTTEPMIYRNGSDNLWIGAKNGTNDHITGGGTYISTGDNKQLWVSKPTDSGRNQYAVLDTQNWKTYLSMVPTVLWSNNSGSKGTITINNYNIKNYDYLEIFYRESNDENGGYPAVQSLRYNCAATDNNGKKLNRFDISSIEASDTSKFVYLRTSRYTISETSITFKRSKYVSLTNGTYPTVSEVSGTDNYFKITKIIGYTAVK